MYVQMLCPLMGRKEVGKLIWMSTPLGYTEDLQDIALLNSDLGNIYGVLHKSCRWWGPRLSAPTWNLFSFHIQLRKLFIIFTARRTGTCVANTTNTNTSSPGNRTRNASYEPASYFPTATHCGVCARKMFGICPNILNTQ